MIRFLISGVLLTGLASCSPDHSPPHSDPIAMKTDSLQLAKMIIEREQAMVEGDIDKAMSQFAEEATWINSQGYYFEGKEEVLKFHGMLAGNDSLDYFYYAGKPRIRLTDRWNAIAYYSWKMFWFRRDNPADTTFREIGLMTLSAQKQKDEWKWIAVTNQHTPWFYEEVEPVLVE